MRVSWMFIILLGCKLSHADDQCQSGCISECKEKLNTYSVPSNGSLNVSVVCPHVPCGQDNMFELLKDGEAIYRYHNTTQNSSTGQGMEVTAHKQGNFVVFHITGAGRTVKTSGVYRCMATKTFPPPLLKIFGGPVAVIGLSINQTNCIPAEAPQNRSPWMWIMAVVLLGTYSVTATVLALVNWSKLKKTCQSDYMNTKPRVLRDRKKKGLQSIPRHF